MDGYDSKAFQVYSEIKQELQEICPDSPIMGTDFFLSIMASGPIRSSVAKSGGSTLPLIFDYGPLDEIDPALLAEADRIREENSGLEEHVIRRQVRDFLDRARRSRGPASSKGVDALYNLSIS